MWWGVGNGVACSIMRTITRGCIRRTLLILIGVIGMIHAHDAERVELTNLKTVNQTGTVGTSDNVESNFCCKLLEGGPKRSVEST
jgi:hypothetical protein